MKVHSAFYLTKIAYMGENIGNEFEIRIRLGSNSITLNKTIKCGETRILNQLLFSNNYMKSHSVSLEVEVTEKDDIPDSGIRKTSINVGTDKGYHGRFSLEAYEEPNKGNKAVFTLVFDEKISYFGNQILMKVGKQGWIKAKFEDGSIESLPLGLHAKITDIITYDSPKDGYIGEEHFTILEGKHINKKARLLIPRNCNSRFSKVKIYDAPCKIVFRIKKKKDDTNLQGMVEISQLKSKKIYAITKICEDTLPNGIYELEIPDAPHPHGNNYNDNSPYSNSWFRIVYLPKPEKGFYFHYGLISAGCITIDGDLNKQIDIWTDIYN